MAKLTLTDITSGYGAVSKYNSNNDAVEAALENTLSRDGTSPNQMNANLDMNSKRIINLPTPQDSNDAARLIDTLNPTGGLYLQRKIKVLDTGRTSTTTRTADPELTGITMSASIYYRYELLFRATSDDSNQIQWEVQPAAGTVTRAVLRLLGGSTSIQWNVANTALTTDADTAGPVMYEMGWIRSTADTTLSFLWAPAGMSVFPVNLKAGSFLRLERLSA